MSTRSSRGWSRTLLFKLIKVFFGYISSELRRNTTGYFAQIKPRPYHSRLTELFYLSYIPESFRQN